jgi:hypothetical protein
VAVEKVYKCDLCGEFVHKDAVRVARVGVLADRPEDCDRVDTGPCCWGRPIADLVSYAAGERKAAEDGE